LLTSFGKCQLQFGLLGGGSTSIFREHWLVPSGKMQLKFVAFKGDCKMKRKHLLFVFTAFLTVFLATPVLAQESATMTAPIIRTAEGAIRLSVHFSNFVQGNRYRIGFGIPGEVTPDVTLELLENEAAVSKDPVDFVQKNTNHWWAIPQLAARGFAFSPSEIGTEGKEFVMRVSVPRELAEKAGKIFLFVSRDYGADTWYLEDGSELNESNW
jgi:hypothetical protein